MTTSRQEAHLDQIWQAVGDVEEADRVLQASVDAARKEGVTWQQIGDLFDMTRSAAQQRFGRGR